MLCLHAFFVAKPQFDSSSHTFSFASNSLNLSFFFRWFLADRILLPSRLHLKKVGPNHPWFYSSLLMSLFFVSYSFEIDDSIAIFQFTLHHDLLLTLLLLRRFQGKAYIVENERRVNWMKLWSKRLDRSLTESNGITSIDFKQSNRDKKKQKNQRVHAWIFLCLKQKHSLWSLYWCVRVKEREFEREKEKEKKAGEKREEVSQRTNEKENVYE